MAPRLDATGALQLDPAKEYEMLRRGRLERLKLPEDLAELSWRSRGSWPLRKGDAVVARWAAQGGTIETGPVKAQIEAKQFQARVYVDGSGVEVYTDAGATLTGRVYGARGPLTLEGDAEGFSGWALEPISADRLTE
jgi:hypothetical protein